MQTVLIVEDKDSMARMLKETLEAEGYRALTAQNEAEGLRKIKQESSDLILTDLKLPDGDGLRILRASREENPLRPVIVMTAFGSVETAVEAMKEGAYDFITKPFNVEHLLVLIRRATENQRLLTENILLREELASHLGLPTIIGRSEGIQDLARKVQKVAPARTTVLLLGESGTGKELFARAVHHLSGRKDYPFVPVNCAAIPNDLLESELFGYEKGAFTGAESRKLGKFELAHEGTIFLDEIGELHPSLQAKLLRVLQEGEVERVGGTKAVRVDVRVVAASNRDLEKAVQEKAFREDLFYRLNVFPLRIPPLRERPEDIPLLTEYFVKKYARELKMPERTISGEAVGMLQGYRWKGNVRELENTVERAMILAEGGRIEPEHISLAPDGAPGLFPGAPGASLDEVARFALRQAETGHIRRALQESGGNKSKAAQSLGVSYKTLLTKIKDYGIR
ncbi:MAG: sigma-54 dependent transcriptional regulator [Nitrospirota bacterium]|jgi:two-component system response regulator AtoC